MFALTPSFFADAAQTGNRYQLKDKVGFMQQSRVWQDGFQWSAPGRQPALAAKDEIAFSGFGKVASGPVRFTGMQGGPHPRFPQVRILTPEIERLSYGGPRTRKVVIGQFRILDKHLKPMQATVTSELQLLSYFKTVFETIRVTTQEPNGTSKRIGYMQLRHSFKEGSPGLTVVTLDTNHEAFRGVGTALMRLAMQRHLLQGFELPIRLSALARKKQRKSYSDKEPLKEVDISFDQFESDQRVSSAPFYYGKQGFRPDDEQPNIEHPAGPKIALVDLKVLDPKDRNRSILLTQLLERGHNDRIDPAIQDKGSVLPEWVEMHLPPENLEAQLSAVWKEPMALVELPEEWRERLNA